MKNDNRILLIATVGAVFLCSLFFTTRAAGQSNSFDAELVTNAQDTIVGRILKFSTDEITLQIDDEPISFSFDRISKLSFGNSVVKTSDQANGEPQGEQPPTWISLKDGSRINAGSFSLQKRDFKAISACGTEIIGDARMFDPILLKPLEPQQSMEMWNEVVDETSRVGDGLVVSRKGKLQSIEGVIAKITDENVTFSVGEQTRDIKREKIQGFFFFRPSRPELTPPLCQLRLIDDSIINLRRIKIEEDSLVLTCVCGIEFVATSAMVAELNFSVGRDVFLSDLEPTSNDWTPLIASPLIVEKLKSFRVAHANSAMSGEALALTVPEENGGTIQRRQGFEHGFSISGGGKLAFALNGQFKSLTGLVGFDPDVDTSGIVKFTIQVDGKIKLQQRMVNADAKNPLIVDIDVNEAKRLVIKVEYEDGRSVGDVVHFVDAKLSR